KYGDNRVAHIATYGTMAPKNAIRDVCRVLDVPIPEANRLAALVPGTPKIDFKKALDGSPELKREKEQGADITRRVLGLASEIDGTTRNRGVHACGVIIARDPLIETIPVMLAKDPDADRSPEKSNDDDKLLTTQYDGHFVEDIGLLKMDFLGLRTLTVFKDCIANIKTVRGVEIDLDKIPFDDAETYDLFGRGDTVGTFQFESEGMRKYLRELQPTELGDLVAMNALYRPGPMDYIPHFIARKHGREAIAYDHPLMEQYLRETYGITVYQEQVMLLSRKLAGFTRGESDTLRKAMGKKQAETMAKLKTKFINGCLQNPAFIEGVPKSKTPEKLIDKIWADWEKFAEYAFNKSHSVGYAIVAYQTGYLKAHYTPEFMSALISSEMGNADKMPVFLNEATDMGYKILPPDVNHSHPIFVPETLDDGKTVGMRYGLAGIKGVGESASKALADERAANGPYKGYMDFIRRQDTAANKKTFESLILAGALDCFGYHRAAMLEDLPSAIKRAEKEREDKASGQISLFGELTAGEDGIDAIDDSEIRAIHENMAPMPLLTMLEKEKEVVGMFVTGHPVSKYRHITRALTSVETVNAKLAALKEKLDAENAARPPDIPPEPLDWKARRKRAETVRFCGLVTEALYKFQKDGKRMLAFTAEDESAKLRVVIFGRDLERLLTGAENPHPEINKDGKKDLLVFEAEIAPNFKGDEAQITVTDYYPLSQAASRLARAVTISCDETFMNTRGAELRALLAAHPGTIPVALSLRLHDKTRVRITCGDRLRILPDEAFAAAVNELLGPNKLAVTV
ncbi:MAG: DNA polymerase III subunit alpha, partial [Kiritimatiellaeota bacterium]|nr:DNA polymerase III subunit alpha [Kiritimatiellota bacterium]